MTLTSTQIVRALLIMSVIAFVAFLIPFTRFHKNLPTGDSQKSILWAQRLLETGQLPNYQEAIPLLNRDPVDFYTPALHYLTAGLLAVGGLPAVGISAIIFSIVTAAVAAGLSLIIIPSPTRSLAALLTFILVLTQESFLRYVREPGYHYQNIIGELLLFSLVALGLLLINQWRWKIFVLAAGTGVILVFTHQFSTFLAAFAVLPIIIALAFKYKRLSLALLPVLGLCILGAVLLGLHEKLPHIFTTNPHLAVFTPSLSRIIEILGPAWLFLGVAGFIVLARESSKNRLRLAALASFAILAALTFGTSFGIDIPPLRTLLYSIIPLSILSAYFLVRLWQTADLLQPKYAQLVAQGVLIGFVIIFTSYSASRAFTLSHTVRTNSTLTPGLLELIEYLQRQPQAATLVDDYDRRSSTWLLLSQRPTFSRLANELRVQMNEARQSKLRQQLYLTQLDFEKIFSLGSRPEILSLMQKHNITHLTGIDDSSVTHFQHNPALQAVKKVDDISLFTFSERSRSNSDRPGARVGRENFDRLEASERTSWLLKPTTLANDIGDLEDTQEYLPASLRATRLSEPQITGSTTYRTTTAPRIPVVFNVDDYARVLWDQDADNLPDASLQLLIQYTDGQEQQKISPRDARIDDRGFITVTIDNPTETPLTIDLIALGLAHTP